MALHHLGQVRAPCAARVVLIPRHLARTIGLGLPVEQLRVDAVAFDQPMEVIPAPTAHLSRSTSSLPTRSRKMIAPSRGITTTPHPQRSLYLGGRCLNVSSFSDLGSRQKQLGCEIPMRSRLTERLHEAMKRAASFPAAPSPAAHRVCRRSDPRHRSERYWSHHPDGSGGGGRSNPGHLSKPDFASDDDPRHRCVISADHPVGDRPRHEPVPHRGTSVVLGWVVSPQR
jgi:hypothetical protein